MIAEGTVTIGLVIIVFSVAAVAVGITIYMHRLVGEAKSEAADEIDRVEKEFSKYREHALETFMSKTGGGLAIDRATAEIKGIRADMKGDIDKLEKTLVGRLDRVEARIFSGNGHSTTR